MKPVCGTGHRKLRPNWLLCFMLFLIPLFCSWMPLPSVVFFYLVSIFLTFPFIPLQYFERDIDKSLSVYRFVTGTMFLWKSAFNLYSISASYEPLSQLYDSAVLVESWSIELMLYLANIHGKWEMKNKGNVAKHFGVNKTTNTRPRDNNDSKFWWAKSARTAPKRAPHI